MIPKSSARFSLRLNNVSKEYGSGRHRLTAVAPVDLELDDRSVIGIIGESGSGKSTLSRIIVGLETLSSGTIDVNGEPLSKLLRTTAGRREYRREVQYVGQDTSSSFDPRLTLRDAVSTPLRLLRGVKDRQKISEKLEEVAHELDLNPALYDRYPHQLSGGQRQRFSLARSLVVEPRILLCDEVVSALDVSVQGQVLNLIKRYVQQNGTGLVFVSHGLPATAFISDELIVMQKGEIVERNAVTQLLISPQHPYTNQLFDAYKAAA